MDLATVGAADLGRGLRGLGLNLLVRDVSASVQRLQTVFGLEAFQASQDFALLKRGSVLLQLHADHSFHAHPLLSVLPEAGARGAGAQFYLFEVDPDAAVAASLAFDDLSLLQPPTNKPHGLREACILDADGYCWSPARPLTPEEIEALGQ